MIVLYLIFFLCFYYWNKKKNKNCLLIKPILILYIIGSFCAIYLYYFVEAKENNIFTIIYQCIIITFSILPIVNYSKHNYTKNINVECSPLFKKVGWFFIIFGLLSICHYVPAIIYIFTSGDFAALRDATNHEGVVYVSRGIFNTISGTVATFYSIMLLFYFYSKCFLNNSRIFNALLLISSTSYIFFVFSSVGRDGIIFWCFSFIFSFCLFRPHMKNSLVKTFKKILITIGAIGGMFFLLITLSRFVIVGGNVLDANGPIVSLISYQGQIFNNFGQYIINVPPSYDPSSLIKLFEDVSKRGDFVSNGIDFYNKYGFDIWIFKGFIIPFYNCMGVFFSLLFFLLYSKVLSSYLITGPTYLSKMIILTLVYQLPFHSYYYLKLASRVGNLYIIASVILALLFYANRKRHMRY